MHDKELYIQVVSEMETTLKTALHWGILFGTTDIQFAIGKFWLSLEVHP